MCKHSLTLSIIYYIALFTLLLPVNAAILQDPTRPPNAVSAYTKSSATPVSQWNLSSTLISNGRRNAIINGQLVSVGQTIQKAKIIAIHPNEVWLLHKKKKIRIKMLARGIKDFSKSADK